MADGRDQSSGRAAGGGGGRTGRTHGAPEPMGASRARRPRGTRPGALPSITPVTWAPRVAGRGRRPLRRARCGAAARPRAAPGAQCGTASGPGAPPHRGTPVRHPPRDLVRRPAGPVRRRFSTQCAARPRHPGAATPVGPGAARPWLPVRHPRGTPVPCPPQGRVLRPRDTPVPHPFGSRCGTPVGPGAAQRGTSRAVPAARPGMPHPRGIPGRAAAGPEPVPP